jgi:hypothetical protein
MRSRIPPSVVRATWCLGKGKRHRGGHAGAARPTQQRRRQCAGARLSLSSVAGTAWRRTGFREPFRRSAVGAGSRAP